MTDLQTGTSSSPSSNLSIPSRPVLLLLFWLPYVSIGATECYLTWAALRLNHCAFPPGMLGCTLLIAQCLYLFGWLGNHYLKVYSILLNLVYFAVAVGFALFQWMAFSNKNNVSLVVTLNDFCLGQVLCLFWIPQIVYLYVAISVPSISEIIPDKLYLGNAGAAKSLDLLQSLNIMHILEFYEEREKKNDRLPGMTYLQLECSDGLSCNDSLLQIGPQAIQFINEAMEEQNGFRRHVGF